MGNFMRQLNLLSRSLFEDVGRKVIVISSCLLENLESVANKTLTDATDKCVSVDFVLLDQVSSGVDVLSESVNNFVKNICDRENCSFRRLSRALQFPTFSRSGFGLLIQMYYRDYERDTILVLLHTSAIK